MICLFQPLNIARHYTDDSVTIVEKSFGLVMHQALFSMGKEITCWLTAVKNKKFQKSTVTVNHIRQHNFATSILPIGFMRDFVLKKVRSKADKEDAPKKGCLTKTFLGHPPSPSKVLVLQGKTETIYDLSLGHRRESRSVSKT